MFEFAIFAVTLVVALIGAIIYLYSGSKRITTIPGPEVMDPMEGNHPDIKACGSFHEFLMEIHDQYGKIASFFFGPRLCVSIASPELFKEQSTVFDRPAELFQLFAPLITEDCIQFANGGEGRKRHAAYARNFSDVAIKQHYPTFIELSKTMAQDLALHAKDQHIPLGDSMVKLAITAMLKTSFGSFFDKKDAVEGLQKSYEFAWEYLERTLLESNDVISPASEELFEKHKANLYDIMGKALKYREKNPPTTEKDKIFIDSLVELGASERTILADALVLLIASFHTTGLLLTWALYYLSENQDVQEKVVKELISVLGDDGEVTPNNINELKYVRQVLDETLRCSILAPFAARVQDFDIELAGHRVPAGTPVVHALGVISQDENVFPEPEKFDPERFDAENSKKRPNLSFEPFGFAGKRKCMGSKFSYVESTICLSVLLRRFKIQLVPGQVVRKVHGLVTKPKEELWFTISGRS